MAISIVLLILLFLVFGANPIINSIIRDRNLKNGEGCIKNPWQQIHDIPGYKEARKVAAFYPMVGEPNIMPVINELCMEERLLLPRCTSDTTMEFYQIHNLKKDLVKGRFGIMEPREGLEPWTGDIPVFLVPGTKFNWDGKRQGHGKGYYDRYLAKYPNSYKAGIATPKQISEEPLEQKPTDIQMNDVIACRQKF